jgi:uncharacterized protein YqhQ
MLKKALSISGIQALDFIKEMHMIEQVKCQQCGSQMEKTTKADKRFALQILGVALFLFGIALLFVFPIGTILGVALMIGSLGLGYSKKKIWKCSSCGYFFERA